jgi:hypothetical protein
MLPFLIALFLMRQVSAAPPENGASGVVEGVVRTAAGNPAAGVRVTAVVPPPADGDVSSNATMASIAQTDAEGRYRLEKIPPGQYYISAGRVDVPTYYPGTIQLLRGTIVTIRPGTVTPEISFVLDDASVGRSEQGQRGASRQAAYNQPPLGDGPVGLTVEVTIQVEGGGKVPVFGGNYYSVLRLVKVPGSSSVEMSFAQKSLILPVPSGTITDEYQASIKGLPDGYSLKSMTYVSTDLQKDTLKFSRQSLTIAPSTSGIGEVAKPAAFIGITLANTPAPPPPGVRVTGRIVGTGDEIYLSGKPGLLLSDGTFEFGGVAPGLHTIVRIYGSTMMAASVLVRDQNVDGVTLQVTPLLPIDLFSVEPGRAAATAPASLLLSSIVGRVVDASSGQPLIEGTLTLTGHRNAQRTFALGPSGFRIPQLLPGQYALTLDVPGYATTAQPVTVSFNDLSLDLKATKAK